MLEFLKNKKYWIVGSIIILIVCGFLLYKAQSKTNETQYVTSKVEKGTIISSVSASGSVTNSSFYTVKTLASGTVKTLFVKDGDEVMAGQKLLSIELDSAGQQTLNKSYASLLAAQTSLTDAETNKIILQNNLASAETEANEQKITLAKNLNNAKAALITAQKNYNYAEGKSSTNIAKINLDSAQKTLEIAQTEFDNIGTESDKTQTDIITAQNKLNNADSAITQAKTNLTTARLNYSDASPNVLSPINGKISGLSIFEGMNIVSSSSSSTNSSSTTGSSTELLSISNQSNPLISVDISETEINKIKVDQKANITLDALPDKTFTGKVVGINKTGEVSSNITNYPVTIQLDLQTNEVLPNMSATVNIILESKTEVLKIPSSAITTLNNINSVQVMNNGKPETKEVQIGLVSDTETEIISGLTQSEEVVTNTITSSSEAPASGSNGTSIFGGIRTNSSGQGGLGASGNARIRQ